MRAREVDDRMRNVGTWVDWERSCDRFIIGDPETEVTGIAVAWQARSAALREAHRRGANLFVTHEPVFYRHLDDDESVFAALHAREKRAFIQDHGIVVYRCHDVWDRMPEVGIVDSWAAALGLSGPIKSDGFHAVYPSPASTLGGLSRHVLAHVKPLNQTSVEMVGNPEAPVRRVAIGCGAITSYETMVRLGADAIIGTDDGMSYWGSGEWALDGGIPLVLVNHCTAEEPGIRNLARYLERQLPDVKVTFLPQGCIYQTVV